MKRKTVIEMFASLLVLLFVYTSVSKLLGFDVFKYQLGRAPYLSSFAGLLSWSLPFIELIVALLLTFNATRLYGFYSSMFLLTAFTIYLGIMVSSGQKLPCTCGGVIQALSWKQHILFNFFFVVLSAAGILLTIRRPRPPVQLVESPIFT